MKLTILHLECYPPPPFYHQMVISPLTSKTNAKWLDPSHAERDLDEQEARATERFLRRFVVHTGGVFCLFFFLCFLYRSTCVLSNVSPPVAKSNAQKCTKTHKSIRKFKCVSAPAPHPLRLPLPSSSHPHPHAHQNCCKRTITFCLAMHQAIPDPRTNLS